MIRLNSFLNHYPPLEAKTCAYLVACFEGSRPNVADTHDLATTMRRHLSAIDAYGETPSVRLAKVIFIVNCVGLKNESLETTTVGDHVISIIRRPNNGYSYGAWARGVHHLLDDDDPPDFAFLIEDDYLPSMKRFLDPFVDRINGHGFVAQRLSSIPGVAPLHASTSNGLLDLRATQSTFEKFGVSFIYYPYELGADDYVMGCENQIMFFSLLQLAGFGLSSIQDAWSVPHLQDGTISETGMKNAPAPLSPIF
ncbi:hypothetical protein MCEKE4_00758 [Acidimicrobiia bacterium]